MLSRNQATVSFVHIVLSFLAGQTARSAFLEHLYVTLNASLPICAWNVNLNNKVIVKFK